MKLKMECTILNLIFMHTNFTFIYIGNILNIVHDYISEAEHFSSVAMKHFHVPGEVFLFGITLLQTLAKLQIFILIYHVDKIASLNNLQKIQHLAGNSYVE